MRKFTILAFVTVLILVGNAICLAQQLKRQPREPSEWSSIRITNTDKDDKPRILLVGDSILIGYAPLVEKNLSSKVYFASYATSRSLVNPDFLIELSLILKRYRFEVIHINNGLHGIGYTEKEYKSGLHTLILVLKRYAPKSKLIWATSTPLRTSNDLSKFSNSNSRIIERNRIAAKIMSKNNITINDLYDAVKDHPEFSDKGGVHYNIRGQAILADMVTGIIDNNLLNKAEIGHGK